jgi:hypothetical protein
MGDVGDAKPALDVLIAAEVSGFGEPSCAVAVYSKIVGWNRRGHGSELTHSINEDFG